MPLVSTYDWPSFALRIAFALMGVEEQLLAGVIGVGLVDPEDLGALGMQCAVRDQLVDRAPGQKRRIQLQQWLRPERRRSQRGLHGVLNARHRQS